MNSGKVSKLPKNVLLAHLDSAYSLNEGIQKILGNILAVS